MFRFEIENFNIKIISKRNDFIFDGSSVLGDNLQILCQQFLDFFSKTIQPVLRLRSPMTSDQPSCSLKANQVYSRDSTQ